MGGLCGGAPRLNRFCQKAAGRQAADRRKVKICPPSADNLRLKIRACGPVGLRHASCRQAAGGCLAGFFPGGLFLPDGIEQAAELIIAGLAGLGAFGPGPWRMRSRYMSMSRRAGVRSMFWASTIESWGSTPSSTSGPMLVRLTGWPASASCQIGPGSLLQSPAGSGRPASGAAGYRGWSVGVLDHGGHQAAGRRTPPPAPPSPPLS